MGAGDAERVGTRGALVTFSAAAVLWFGIALVQGALASETPLPRVIVRGDEQAYYKLVWEVIGIARSAGYDDVALSARSKP